MEKKFLLILFSIFLNTVSAQKIIITGLVLDSIHNSPVEFASVTNISKNKTIICNNKGFFNMVVSFGDVLSVASVNHYFDTISVQKNILKDTIIFILKPITKNLGEVTVETTINKYVYDSTQRRKQFLAKVGNGKIPVFSSANSGAGLGFNITHFSKSEKIKRNAYKLFDLLEKEQYINYRFSPVVVTKYTQLQNEALLAFMQAHRPTYKWLRLNVTEEDIKYYINEKLKLKKTTTNN
ncbi:MAG TPA: hypothetical protein PLU36_00915 [Chitinophagaceae bacterium]|nr:hypothetical protein [Chitinophagaceae bacterium]HMZ45340.1 hypothetical protein [Chitinophagaceae bacterium]HNE93733.1 hypothetical protein [Chitinophagaceae bacterium]HNF30334.1 hypothetical protein [Chitinophagaceae bacterium]HNJ58013.1 hypothetical protein [Chitinophagaceae bacterium]